MENKKMHNRKGLSDVITTVLIILFVLMAVVLVWAFIRIAILGAGEQISSSAFEVNQLSLTKGSLNVNESNATLFLTVRRESGEGKLKGFVVVLQDINKKTSPFRFNYSLKEFEAYNLFIDYSGFGLVNVDKIYLAPLFESDSGKEVLGRDSLVYELLGGVDSICGDGKIESYEECDSDNLNGENCLSLGYMGGELKCNIPGERGQCRLNKEFCVPKDNLYARYSFEEGVYTGLLNDVQDSFGINPGTSNRTPLSVSSQIRDFSGNTGKAIKFNGINQSVKFSNPNNFNFENGVGNFTISLWTNKYLSPEPVNVWQHLITKGAATWNPQKGYGFSDGWGSWAVFLFESNSKRVYCGGNFYCHTTVFENEGWHHIAFVKDNKVKFYHDGSLVIESDTLPLGLDFSSSAPLSLGAYTSPAGISSGFYNGSVDELMVYNRSLSGKEIVAIYESQKPI